MRPRSSVVTLSLSGAVLLLLSPMLVAQAQSQSAGPPEWAVAVRHDTSRPLREIPPTPAVSTRTDFAVKQAPPTPGSAAPDRAVQSFAVAPLAATPGTGFDGVGEGNSQFPYDVNVAPPDTVGEASLTQYVQWVNTSFAIFDKESGTLRYGPAGGNTIWQGFGGDCQNRNDGDPIVQYDQLADRWIMTQFSLRFPNYLQCVAVSQTSDATGAWHRYAFSYSEFPDYPKLSVWPDAYYISFNMFGRFGTNFTGSRVCAYDRAKMLNGQPAAQLCYQLSNQASFLPADLEGRTLPPSGTPHYVMNRGSSTSINLWRFTPNFAAGTSSFTGPTPIAVEGYTAACGQNCIPQPGTTQKLDAIGDRLMYRLVYRNLGGRESLVANHSVLTGGVTGVRWYEFDVTGGTPSVRQQGTYAPGDGQHRWMGSIAIDAVGNIAVGYSIGSGTMKPSIRFAGREATDPVGVLSIEETMQTGTGSQGTNLSRWGDYSAMTIDPADDCTFWYTSEYLKTDGTWNWSTRIGSFKFASCGSTPPPPPSPSFQLGASPPSQTVTQGQSTTYDVTVTGQNGYTGSGTYSVTGLPTDATGTFDPTGYNGGSGASTLTVTTSSSTPAGSYNLTIHATGSDGVSDQSTMVTLVVEAITPADFSVSASPSNRTVKRGNSTTYTVTVTPSGGFAETVAFSVSDLPGGTSSSFDPGSVSGGGTSTLTVTTTSSTPKGAYTLTITGMSPSLTRSTTVTLRVN